ncbi:MAG: Aspartyl/Asparaginyl beta-hydroxylase [Gammaproteobacteria bacterium]|nr:Aspartyl/Asparaginyl beta-hydroxylase [Gammaproteobacteria bacterium]
MQRLRCSPWLLSVTSRWNSRGSIRSRPRATRFGRSFWTSWPTAPRCSNPTSHTPGSAVRAVAGPQLLAPLGSVFSLEGRRPVRGSLCSMPGNGRGARGLAAVGCPELRSNGRILHSRRQDPHPIAQRRQQHAPRRALAADRPSRLRFPCRRRTARVAAGKAFIFDDTIEHEAWNDGDLPRAVLIVRLAQSQHLPVHRRPPRQLDYALDLARRVGGLPDPLSEPQRPRSLPTRKGSRLAGLRPWRYVRRPDRRATCAA